MKTKMKLSLSIVLMALLSFPLMAQDMEKEMVEMTKKYEKAYNAEDVNALVAMYTSDGVRTFNDGRNYKGAAEIAAGLTAEFAANNFKVSIKHEKVVPAGVGKATATGTYRVTGKTAEGESVDVMGKYTNTLIKIDGEWKVARTDGEIIQ
ncbi:YybH family protein [Algoriphagus marinus]|uniref:YybH family protein n=1 Tax=Algoriphagus marinus TaxID=1925762 RepID=UPI00094B95E0|nr:DUF4440 domain-containing protein [Algoriphagus marinus]